MILDVTRVGSISKHALSRVSWDLSLELVKDLLKRLAYNVTKDVHTASVRHTNDYIADTGFNKSIEGNLKTNNE